MATRRDWLIRIGIGGALRPPKTESARRGLSVPCPQSRAEKGNWLNAKAVQNRSKPKKG